MAVGVLPSQVNGVNGVNGANGNGPKAHVAVDSPLESISYPSHTSPLLMHAASRPFFWEIVQLCDLYSIAHVILLPTSLRTTYSHVPELPRRNGISNRGGHRPVPEPPTRFAATLSTLGLGPPNWVSAGISVFTAILPSQDGYVSRSDFLQIRLQDCPFPISRIREAVHPLQRYTSCTSTLDSINSEDGLARLFEHAAAVIQWADLDASMSILDLQRYLLGLTHELRGRLNNAPWLTSQPVSRKRVALIRGRPSLTAGGPVYRAARALGLDLVVIDDEGHWLQPDTEENRMHREAFLATDMTEDSGVVGRIINSITCYPLPIHGVFTLSDNFFVTVAKVAQALGLPTSPVSAFETSVDKYRSRLLQDAPGHTARVGSLDELDALLQSGTMGQRPAFTPKFPMIVKPTKGWSSECVSKVNNLADLGVAVLKATARHGSAAVIEPFFDGPEVDVNFVLLDGEILFSEIADEPPCEADSRSATVHHTFSPEALTLPSALPPNEQSIAISTLRDILVKLGFRTGVFHVEARMVNSACEYRRTADNDDGIIDLVRKPPSALPEDQAACKLVEINARPPGYRVTVPSRHTYGVDFFAAHMLAAVGDLDRLRLVARPFDHHPSPHADDGSHHHHQPTPAAAPLPHDRGAQYHARLVYVPAPRAGTIRWPAGLPPCEELKRRRPDLAERIVLAVDYCAPGDRVNTHTDGARTYVAHLLVVSRESRAEAVRLGEEVLREMRVAVEGDEEKEGV